MHKGKPPPDRLYGRTQGKKLRPRQEWLLEHFLPRLTWPDNPFAITPRDLWLEIGFGGGEHAHALAAANPEIGLIAAEVFVNGICSLLSRLAPESEPNLAPPPNLRILPADARPLIRALPNGALDKIFLMFPDPWPKARHAKRRFIHPETIPELARVLAPGGEFRVASDDPTYQAWTDHVLAAQSHFSVIRHTARPGGWPPTRYEAKALTAGRLPAYWSLRRL
jgi:tRNA (guanine-N7-)-methyltransferase